MPPRSATLPALALLLLCLLSLLTVSNADDIPSDLSPEDLAAEEAAAAAVGDLAEEEDEDDADALDEDADAARFSPDRHPLTDMPPPADDVLIAHTFTHGIDSSLIVALGDKCRALIAFANAARARYHVWGVMGSLNMERDFKVHVQNFSYVPVNKSVASNSELSFTYEFTPNERLDVRPFQLALTVFYEAQGSSGNAIRGHSTTFYNATITTVPGPQSMSNAMFMTIFALVVAAVVAAVLLFRQAEQKKDTVEMGTATASKNEWLEDHHAMIASGGGRAKAKLSAKSS
eukprot:GFKZ01011675.1.p2 GENE.GFKZ01011675.1~~GFKZ01011675.1.p2  ORF type:complete len:289 (-),score=56.39 GFKZ01011675.1:1244-2110(-)